MDLELDCFDDILPQTSIDTVRSVSKFKPKGRLYSKVGMSTGQPSPLVSKVSHVIPAPVESLPTSTDTTSKVFPSVKDPTIEISDATTAYSSRSCDLDRVESSHLETCASSLQCEEWKNVQMSDGDPLLPSSSLSTELLVANNTKDLNARQGNISEVACSVSSLDAVDDFLQETDNLDVFGSGSTAVDFLNHPTNDRLSEENLHRISVNQETTDTAESLRANSKLKNSLQHDTGLLVIEEVPSSISLDPLDDILFHSKTSGKATGKFQPKFICKSKNEKNSRVLCTNIDHSLSISSIHSHHHLESGSFGNDNQNFNSELQVDNQCIEAPGDLCILDSIDEISFLPSGPSNSASHSKPSDELENTPTLINLSQQPLVSPPTDITCFLPTHTDNADEFPSPFQPNIFVSSYNNSTLDPCTELADKEVDLVRDSSLETSPAHVSVESQGPFLSTDGKDYEYAKKRIGENTSQQKSRKNRESSWPFLHKDSAPTRDEINEFGTSRMQLRNRVSITRPRDESEDGHEISNDSELGGSGCNERKGYKDLKKRMVRQTDDPENNKSNARQYKSSENSNEKEFFKKKFCHSTQRKRRRVPKDLLDKPEEEIDPRRLAIRDLILLAEFKERQLTKEAAQLKKTCSAQSKNFFSTDDTNCFASSQGAQHNDCSSPLVEERSAKLNYHTYMKKTPCERWSKSETELFYEAIRQFGTDFTMIQQLFPGRTRQQVKLKFKKEERQHPLQVSDALFSCSKDHSHFELVIKRLQEAQAEQNSKKVSESSDINEGEEVEEEISVKEAQTEGQKEEYEDDEIDTDFKAQESQDVDEWSQFGDFNSACTPEDLEKEGYSLF